MEAFRFSATQLCEPADAAFQAWLAAIPYVSSTGVVCPVSSDKPPLVLVHGIQLFGKGYRCSQGIGRYQQGTPSTLDVPGASEDLADWLAEEYDVWIAHLSSGLIHTPPLETNAECLEGQIEKVFQTTGKKVVVAHSMGAWLAELASLSLLAERRWRVSTPWAPPMPA